MKEIKLCKDCEYCEVGVVDKFINGYRYAKCIRLNSDVDLVSGKKKKKSYYCSIEREDSLFSRDCGIGGKFFKPKKRKRGNRK